MLIFYAVNKNVESLPEMSINSTTYMHYILRITMNYHVGFNVYMYMHCW